MINEIMYHPPDGRELTAFVELFNRSEQDIDISGFRFNRGVSYTFEEGTVLASGAYLAIAADPETLRAAHEAPGEGWGTLPIVGPFEGELSNKGELLRLVDTLGTPVDEVRYHDGGLWPKWADGGGSSLELLDPNQDNSVASAWENSDESAKSRG